MNADGDVYETDDDDDDDDDDEAGACEWTEWSEWTECTVTCGRGFIIRHRTAHKSASCRKSFIVQQKPCPTRVACPLRQFTLQFTLYYVINSLIIEIMTVNARVCFAVN